MYTQYYLQARDAAEKIRQGSFQVPKTETPQEAEGFMARKARMEQQQTEVKPDPETMVLDYMSMVQESNPLPRVEGELGTALEALSAVESGGRYDALGPVMPRGSYKGDRAYGKYQVMGGNIPSWTKEALGVSMTPEAFLASPKAQDAVAAYRMQQYRDKYGTWEDAASVWFTGRPLAKAGNASDGYTDVQSYVAKFQANWRTA
jgi:hypothetical protein